MVEKIKQQNLLKIPDLILKRVGLHPGDYVEVSDDGYKIIITPKVAEEDFSEEEWEKLEKLAKGKKGRAFTSGKNLLNYLDKITKE